MDLATIVVSLTHTKPLDTVMHGEYFNRDEAASQVGSDGNDVESDGNLKNAGRRLDVARLAVWLRKQTSSRGKIQI